MDDSLKDIVNRYSPPNTNIHTLTLLKNIKYQFYAKMRPYSWPETFEFSGFVLKPQINSNDLFNAHVRPEDVNPASLYLKNSRAHSLNYIRSLILAELANDYSTFEKKKKR